MTTTILDVRAGVHEAFEPEVTADRFPGARWTRDFVAGPDGTNLPASTTADQLVSKVLAKVGPALATPAGGCLMSLKLDLVAAAAGAWNSRLLAVGRALAGLNVIVTIDHEPEDTYRAPVFDRGFTAARGALKLGCPDLDVAYCAMSYQWRPGSLTTTDPAPWAQVEADLYLIDVYSGKNFRGTAILPEHPGFRRWHAEVVAKFPGRRWGIAERGWLADPGRPATIDREADWLTTDPVGQTCEVYIVWATGGTENNPGWLLDDRTAAAVARLLTRLTLPPGYTAAAGLPLVLHVASGAVVARDKVAAWNAVYGRLLDLGAARSVA